LLERSGNIPTRLSKAPERNVTVRVIGVDQITTPAGTFKALRIEKNVNWARSNSQWGTAVTNTPALYFYSTYTNSVIRMASEAEDGAKREVELVKFEGAQNDASRSSMLRSGLIK
jgi:hypothetical protein